MSKKIVNLTVPAVVEVIETILATYPRDPHQVTFAIPTLRQKLTTYVLSRVENCYIVIENGRFSDGAESMACSSPVPHSQIEAVVHDGIKYLLEEAQANEPEVGMVATPSYWFG